MFTYDNTTVDQLKKFLDEHGITYASNATKQDLVDLANKVPTADTSDQTDAATDDADKTAETASTEPEDNTETIEEPPLKDEPAAVKPITEYTVKQGDNIAIVATRFGLSVGKLRLMNEPLGFTLTAGRVLTVG
ncbi:HeH/LEM domain-containing protein [Weissella sp. MSCH1]|uniref:HeH/LEM domain-containing protein n=1 Tax=Weissella sp. MSCH1 TaxID=3383343 RepID=UPI003896EC19